VVKDKRWIDVRKIELKKRKNEERPVIKERKEEVLSPYQKILEIIGSLDFGKGADYHEVIAKSKVVDCERMINALLEQGEIFEIRPGKLKVLE